MAIGAQSALAENQRRTPCHFKTLAALSAQLSQLETATSPFLAVTEDGAEDAVWIRPELFVEVAYNDESADGHLRHPKYIGLAKRAPKKRPPAAPAIKLTHADRVLYPAAGITKADLLDYYQAVSHHLLAHIAERFVSLVRAPDGKLDKAFFQRHEFAGQPDSIEVARNMGGITAT